MKGSGPSPFKVNIQILHPVSEFMDLVRNLFVCPAGFTDAIDTLVKIIEHVLSRLAPFIGADFTYISD